jgi:hypothetical protein
MLRMFKNIAQANRPEVGVPQPVRYSTGVPNEYYRDFVSSGEFRNPKKTLLRDGDTVFTMGSCFANEIRAYLHTHQLADTRPQVPAVALPSFHDRSKEISSWGEWDGTSNLQFYNTFSIRQEIEKSVGGWTQSPNDFWQVEIGGETLYQCPYRRRIFAETPEALNRITILIDEEIKASLKAANLIVFTLGLTEVWQKKDNGLFSCCEPGYCHGAGGDETEFVASSYEQNLFNLQRTIEIINQEFGKKQILISVSPVPLGRTFRPLEAYVANIESKSILRSVAGCIDNEFENATYFPSYEMCLSDPTTFREDGRHVKPKKVNQIMDFFQACHRASV